MKSILLGGVIAAMLGLATPSQAQPAAPYNWTGLYVGGNVGYSWGDSDITTSFFNNTTGLLLATTAGSFDMNGWLAGVQLGYNWQYGRWVFGIEGDFQWTGQDGGRGATCPIAGFGAGPCNNLTFGAGLNQPIGSTFNQSLDWFATLRVRAGLTLTPTILAYVTGGLAVGNIDTDGTIAGFTGASVPVVTAFGSSDTNWGWTIGAGVEAALSGNWTAKFEYLYMDLGSVSTVGYNLANVVPLRVNYESDITDHILRIGLNYRFY